MTRTFPIDSRRGQHTELRLTDAGAEPVPFAIGLFPVGSDTGICIGVGATALAALNDALDSLQQARWALHDQIALEGRRRGVSARGMD